MLFLLFLCSFIIISKKVFYLNTKSFDLSDSSGSKFILNSDADIKSVIIPFPSYLFMREKFVYAFYLHCSSLFGIMLAEGAICLDSFIDLAYFMNFPPSLVVLIFDSYFQVFLFIYYIGNVFSIFFFLRILEELIYLIL
jgi:hypothetical protein